MKGNMVSQASLGSYGRFKELELCKGDIIKVSYDIIPYADFDITDYNCKRRGGKVIEAPVICNDCLSELVVSDTGELLYCTNPKCPCRLKGKILNYCKNMGISGISYATVNDLYNNHLLTNIEDIYTLKDHISEISNIEGYGAKKIKNILDEIENHKEVIPSVLLGSLGIETISTKKFKTILEYMTMSEIIDVCHEKNYSFFTVIPGIKEKTAKKLVDGINDSIHTINVLIHELDVLPEPRSKGDYSVVFTKIRDKELEDWISENGGVVSDALTKDTSILVTPTAVTKSSKVEKANKYNIPVVPITELKDFITNKYL